MSDSEEFNVNMAKKMDSTDPLSHFKERFFTPTDTTYLNGNSLGLLSKDAATSLLNSRCSRLD